MPKPPCIHPLTVGECIFSTATSVHTIRRQHRRYCRRQKSLAKCNIGSNVAEATRHYVASYMQSVSLWISNFSTHYPQQIINVAIIFYVICTFITIIIIISKIITSWHPLWPRFSALGKYFLFADFQVLLFFLLCLKSACNYSHNRWKCSFTQIECMCYSISSLPSSYISNYLGSQLNPFLFPWIYFSFHSKASFVWGILG